MSTCPRCNSTFACAMADLTDGPCWCTGAPIEPALPVFPELGDQARCHCFCPVCLGEWRQPSTTPPAET